MRRSSRRKNATLRNAEFLLVLGWFTANALQARRRRARWLPLRPPREHAAETRRAYYCVVLRPLCELATGARHARVLLLLLCRACLGGWHCVRGGAVSLLRRAGLNARVVALLHVFTRVA